MNKKAIFIFYQNVFYDIITNKREMKNIIKIFSVTLLILPIVSAKGAVQIKKAAPVETKSATSSQSGSSLALSTVSLALNVIDINKQQKSLDAECVPSQKERNFVDTMMKEWAKAGNSVPLNFNRKACTDENGNGYAKDIQSTEAEGIGKACFNSFKGPGNDDMIWSGYPRVGYAEYTDENNKKVIKSDIYDLFVLIDFEPVDYKADEITMAGNLLKRVENCSSAKLNSKKKALWGTFLLNTAGNLGQKTDSATVLQQVSNISSTGGSGLGNAATQILLMNAMKDK